MSDLDKLHKFKSDIQALYKALLLDNTKADKEIENGIDVFFHDYLDGGAIPIVEKEMEENADFDPDAEHRFSGYEYGVK